MSDTEISFYSTCAQIAAVFGLTLVIEMRSTIAQWTAKPPTASQRKTTASLYTLATSLVLSCFLFSLLALALLLNEAITLYMTAIGLLICFVILAIIPSLALRLAIMQIEDEDGATEPGVI